MNHGKAESNRRTPRVPFERDCANPFEIQYGDRRCEQECKEGEYPEIHDEGLSENEGITDILEHGHSTITVPFRVGWIISLYS